MPSISFLVPAFNEAARVGNTIQTLLQVPEIKKIVCVDDGSTDGTGEIITAIGKKHSQVIPIVLQENIGKAEAISVGLENITEDFTVLFDADLKYLNAQEISEILSHVTKKIDMLFFRRVHSVPSTRLVLGDMLLTGERLVKTEDLRQVYKEYCTDGFLIEMALNRYMRDHQKNVAWAAFSGENVLKMQKYSILRGLQYDLKMYASLITQGGVSEYIRQFSWGSSLPELQALSRN